MSDRKSVLEQAELERSALELGVRNQRTLNEVNTSVASPSVIVIDPTKIYEFPHGLSGSLTKLVSGEDYLIAGKNISLLTGSNGSITITGILSAGGSNTQVQFNDGNSTFGGDPSFVYNKNTNTLSVTNLSGSLTKLSNGSDYLIAGPGITLSTGSNGSITIGSSAPQWNMYSPIISVISGQNPTLPSTYNLYGRYLVQGKLMTMIFSFSGIASDGNPGSGNYKISMPSGYTIDESIIDIGTPAQDYINGTPVGIANLITNTAGSGGAWSVIANSTNTLILLGQNPLNSSQPIIWGSNNFGIGSVSSYYISFIATIPLS